MKRQFFTIHAEDDKVRPRFVRALEASFQKMGERLDLEAVERAVARKDHGAAREAVDSLVLDDPLTPAGTILGDAFIKGAKLTVKEQQ